MYITRSEQNGTDEFYTLRDAHVAADCDLTIWKITKLLITGELLVFIRLPSGEWERVHWDADRISEEINLRREVIKP
jgi:hypothetical protein